MSAVVVEAVAGTALIEDLGRPGWAHLGVPGAGALDPEALRLANRLVGNAEHLAGVEVLLGGLRVVARGSTRVALTGASLDLRVEGRAAPWGTSVSVPDGAILEVRPSDGALRGWLALAGGVDVPPVLGSRSTDTLSGLGPAPLRAGDVLPLGPSGPAPDGGPVAVPPAVSTGVVELRVRVGPRADWFTTDSLAGLWGSTLGVSASSDRVGVRLSGDPLVRRIPGELPSEGLVTGAVQVTGDGRPLVFLADHPTTGGYPVVAVVVSADLCRCAQLRPGDAVRLRPP